MRTEEKAHDHGGSHEQHLLYHWRHRRCLVHSGLFRVPLEQAARELPVERVIIWLRPA